METELILVRHGQTVWNQERRLQGQADSPLSPQGQAQVDALARRLWQERFDVLYTSDLGRAYETARRIAALTGHPVRLDARLRERNNGLFEGLTQGEAATHHPELFAAYRAATPDFAVPGGESLADLQERALTVFTELAQRHPGERLVVVSHGGLLTAFARAVLNLPWSAPRSFRLENASVTVAIYHATPPTWRLGVLGDTAHLVAIAG